MAANADDLAILYSYIGGPDEEDKNTQCQPSLSLYKINEKSLSKVRIGIYWDYFNHVMDVDIVTACKNALEFYKEQGATVVDIDIPQLEEFRLAHLITIASEGVAALDSIDPTIHSYLTPSNRLFMSTAKCIGSMVTLQFTL